MNWGDAKRLARSLVRRTAPGAQPAGEPQRLPEPAASAPVGDPAVRARREALARANVDAAALSAPGTLGLAFSGGGIRSATIALGATQALARHGRLLDFDYLSTVSGGGYIGSFLTTLFLPISQRGLGDEPSAPPSAAELAHQRAFAIAALSAKVQQQHVAAPDHDGDHGSAVAGDVRSPVWWLREHGRYLAPNGAVDYATSAAYLVRNWLAMLYVFALPVALIFLATTSLGRAGQTATWPIANVAAGTWLTHAVHGHLPPETTTADPGTGAAAARPDIALRWSEAPAGVDLRITGGAADAARTSERLFSPILLLSPLFLFGALAAGLAYWLTAWQPMVSVGSTRWSPAGRFMAGSVAFLLLSVAGLLIVSVTGAADRLPRGPLVLLVFGLASTATATTIAIAAGLVEWKRPRGVFVMALRRRLTKAASDAGLVTVALLVLGVIDSLALAVVANIGSWSPRTIATGLLLPIGAWLINKLPQWFGGDGRALRWLAAHTSIVALVVGCVLFGGFALLVDAVLQACLWPIAPWASGGGGWSWPITAGIAVVLVALTLLTGRSDGFINLSSLHNLYAARLTRAYLGASNLERLRKDGKGIRESQSCDDLPIDRYATTRTCAPIHLVNVTLNETRSRDNSQLTDRDRKGVPVVFGPEGILVDAARTPVADQPDWACAKLAGIERLTVGQLCAISGAAASTGMGARTSLGTSIALTFANIRLGYWWRVDEVLNRGTHRHLPLLAPFARTFYYLLNELRSRYSREDPRVYLSDGGHFDNSGAYELLRRKVGTLLVYDNGADPQFRFEDLENLVRKARIDLGLSVNVCSGDAVKRLFGVGAAPFFLNGPGAVDDRFGDDWRARAAARDGGAVGLLLCAYERGDAEGEPRPSSYIVWMKPRLSDVLPQDVRGYGLANATFPHQSTGDQFFDEAQWESYRALGESMTITLLRAGHCREDILRDLARRVGGAG